MKGVWLCGLALMLATAGCATRAKVVDSPFEGEALEKEAPETMAERAEEEPLEGEEPFPLAGGLDAWREVVLQPEGEKQTAPVVAAFPIGMRHRVLEALETVFFSFDSPQLSPEAKAVLENNLAWLKLHPEKVVRVIGHADERGAEEYNLALGMRRAEAVKRFLTAGDVPEKRLETMSYGEEMPLNRQHTERAWRKNRRVEFALPKEKLARHP